MPPAPKRPDIDYRMECMKLAAIGAKNPYDAVQRAAAYWGFVETGDTEGPKKIIRNIQSKHGDEQSS